MPSLSDKQVADLKSEHVGGGIVIGIVMSIIVGTILYLHWSGEERKKAIDSKHAYYHPTTGEFTYKNGCLGKQDPGSKEER